MDSTIEEACLKLRMENWQLMKINFGYQEGMKLGEFRGRGPMAENARLR